jgi:hypothetical protein
MFSYFNSNWRNKYSLQVIQVHFGKHFIYEAEHGYVACEHHVRALWGERISFRDGNSLEVESTNIEELRELGAEYKERWCLCKETSVSKSALSNVSWVSYREIKLFAIFFMLASLLADSWALKIEATRSSETSVDIQRAKRCYITHGRTLHNHRCENLISYKHTNEFHVIMNVLG